MKTLIKLLKNPLGATGIVLLVFFAVVAIIAPYIAPPRWPDEPFRMPRYGYWSEPRPPQPGHPFGLSSGQYDIFYGCVWGTRLAWIVSLLVVGLSAAIGIFLGMVGAFYGGLVDEVIMRITDIFYAFPFLSAAMALAAILGHTVKSGVIALVTFGWMSYARLIRGEVLRLKEV
ncbi:MAG TPA: ABC transporter permease, partial [Candidatus Acetothermia bacterium]|nr:ABC transporter permease [Candidatus Acetothermia bacterium]